MDRIYFGNIKFAVGDSKNLTQLLEEDLISSEVDKLQEEGYQKACVTSDNHLEMLYKIADIHSETDLILYYNIFPHGIVKKYNNDLNKRYMMEEFLDYSARNLLLDKAQRAIDYIGISQQGCGGIFTCLNIAMDKIVNKQKNNILCISDDVLPTNCFYDRPKQKMLFSDTVSTITVSSSENEFQLVDIHSKTVLNENFLTVIGYVTNLIKEMCKKNNINPTDIENIIFPNFWRRCWDKVIDRLGIKCRYKDSTIKEIAHGFSADIISNIDLYRKREYFTQGKYQISIGYGYGSHLHCMIYKFLG